MTLRGGFDGAHTGLLVADIGNRHLGLATGRPDRSPDILQRIRATAAEDHERTLLGETDGGGRADARAGTGDEGDLAPQTLRHCVLSWIR